MGFGKIPDLVESYKLWCEFWPLFLNWNSINRI
jgi:hypothetical protein